MVESKAWDWSVVDKNGWLEPSEESLYLAGKWKQEGMKTMLDLGCGRGRHAILFAKSGYEVTAVDLSEEAVQYVKAWSEHEKLDITCKVSDMNHLPFADNSFDCLFSYHVISHTDTEGIVKIMNEITRVLKPNGRLFVTLCSKEHYAFQEKSYPHIDENTCLKTEGAETEVPHFFVDIPLIKRLFINYQLERVRHITECTLNDDGREYSHYYIEAVVMK